MSTAIVILAHGSKTIDSKTMFMSLLEKVKQKLPGESVVPAYLQFTEPNLEQAIDSLYQNGFQSIHVMPLFLFPGNHVKQDIPALVETIQKKYPQLNLIVKDIIGDDDKMAEIIIDRIVKE